MSERRVQLPEAAEDFVMDGLDTSSAAVALFAARKLAQWLVANPQVPTDEQIDSIEFEPCSTARWAKQCITEFQRRFLFAPAEPEDPVADLIEKHFGTNPADWVKDLARECFKRGQQSMITKEKQP